MSIYLAIELSLTEISYVKGGSMARVNERVEVHSVRDFPQAKLDSQINARFS